MKKSLLVLTVLAVMGLSTGARAADPLPSTLFIIMTDMQAALVLAKKDIEKAQPTFNTASLRKFHILAAETLNAIPSKLLAIKDTIEQRKAQVAYQKAILTVLNAALDMESAMMAQDKTAATDQLNLLIKMLEQGHKDFK